MSFEDIDKLFGTDNVRSGYDMLREHYNGKEKSPDLLWRLAKFCHELAGRTTDKEKKKELILEGRDYAVEGHHLDEDHFNAVKWAAIMTGQSTDYLGTKEKIEQGSKFKEYLDRALLIDAKEYALLHMRGRYSYSVANLSWFEKRLVIAKTYLSMAIKLKPVDDSENELLQEATKLVGKC
uniref:Tetratricopeptide repeat protein n=1 Tax=Heterorhabditis bacteriophora TaxID=37862 RepID=A0A1I7XNE4_HETBA